MTLQHVERKVVVGRLPQPKREKKMCLDFFPILLGTTDIVEGRSMAGGAELAVGLKMVTFNYTQRRA